MDVINNTITKEIIIIRTSRGLTINGTRITLYSIIDKLKDDWPPQLIQDWYNLSNEQIQGALDYIEANQEEVEAEYQQVLANAVDIKRYWEERNRDRITQIMNLPPPPGKEKVWEKLQEKKASLLKK